MRRVGCATDTVHPTLRMEPLHYLGQEQKGRAWSENTSTLHDIVLHPHSLPSWCDCVSVRASPSTLVEWRVGRQVTADVTSLSEQVQFMCWLSTESASPRFPLATEIYLSQWSEIRSDFANSVVAFFSWRLCSQAPPGIRSNYHWHCIMYRYHRVNSNRVEGVAEPSLVAALDRQPCRGCGCRRHARRRSYAPPLASGPRVCGHSRRPSRKHNCFKLNRA